LDKSRCLEDDVSAVVFEATFESFVTGLVIIDLMNTEVPHELRAHGVDDALLVIADFVVLAGEKLLMNTALLVVF
jgi:hypothetical protein